MNVHATSIVVDRNALEALRIGRAHAATLADEYVSKRIPARGQIPPGIDLRTAALRVMGLRARLH